MIPPPAGRAGSLAAGPTDPVLVLEREHPRPGELWRYADVRVTVTGVSRDLVTYSEHPFGSRGMSREAMLIFLEVFYRATSSAEALRR